MSVDENCLTLSEARYILIVSMRTKNHVSFFISSLPFSNLLTNCFSRKPGAKNFNQSAALAENVAATIKSDLFCATEVRISAATSLGSAPIIRKILKAIKVGVKIAIFYHSCNCND